MFLSHKGATPAIAAILVSCILLPAVARAAGPTKEQCMSANEDASVLRKRGKLLAAKTSLEACTASTCPQVIRDDCQKLLDEVKAAIPSVVLKVVEGTTPLTDVKVLMDNEPLTERLDDHPIVVEPGPHTFKFFALNHDTKTLPLEVKEGEKEHVVTVDLGPAAVVTSGRLTVKSEPGATITFDGAPLTGAAGAFVVPGRHHVRVVKQGTIPAAFEIEMKGGGEASVDVKLEKHEKPSLVPWIIGGAVVLAGLLIGGGIVIAAGE